MFKLKTVVLVFKKIYGFIILNENVQQLSVLNLLNTGERYIAGQAEKIPTSPLPQTAPPPPTSSVDVESPFFYPGRACTR